MKTGYCLDFETARSAATARVVLIKATTTVLLLLQLLLHLQPPRAEASTLLLDTTNATIGTSTTPNVGGTTSGLGFLFRTGIASPVTQITAIIQRATGSNLVAAYEASSVEVYRASTDGTLANRLGSFRPSCLSGCSSNDIAHFGSTDFHRFSYEGEVALSADTRYWLLIRSTALGDFGRRFFLPLGSFSYGDSPWRFATSSNWFFEDSFTDNYSTLSSAPLFTLTGSDPDVPTSDDAPAAAETADGAAAPVPGPQGISLLALSLLLTLAASRQLRHRNTRSGGHRCAPHPRWEQKVTACLLTHLYR